MFDEKSKIEDSKKQTAKRQKSKQNCRVKYNFHGFKNTLLLQLRTRRFRIIPTTEDMNNGN